MEAAKIFVYIVTLVVMVVLDLTWLGVVAKGFYQKHMGNLLEFKTAPAVLFYLMYAAAVVYFTSLRPKQTWQSVAMDSALLGFTAYATYDLTNLATIRGWSLQMALADMAWGTFATTVAGTLGAIVASKF
jgi:uncharacterized membrane protein